MNNNAIVQKLWSLCDILPDDGITYHQYVTELTLLLFLKMAQETGTEHRLPVGNRWGDLKPLTGGQLHQRRYQHQGTQAPGAVRLPDRCRHLHQAANRRPVHAV